MRMKRGHQREIISESRGILSDSDYTENHGGTSRGSGVRGEWRDRRGVD